MKHRFKQIKAREKHEQTDKGEEAEQLNWKNSLRAIKISNNYLKQRKKVAKLATHIANQKRDFLHKKSNELTDQYEIISVEDINMKGMAKRVKRKGKKTKRKRWGKSVSDNAFGMFRQFLSYKQERKGHAFIKIDKFYPSSQLCHECGFKNPITKDIEVREIVCPECGSVYDRDVNAAKNIDLEGLRVFYTKLGLGQPEVKSGDILSDLESLLQRGKFLKQRWLNHEAPRFYNPRSGGNTTLLCKRRVVH